MILILLRLAPRGATPYRRASLLSFERAMASASCRARATRPRQATYWAVPSTSTLSGATVGPRRRRRPRPHPCRDRRFHLLHPFECPATTVSCSMLSHRPRRHHLLLLLLPYLLRRRRRCRRHNRRYRRGRTFARWRSTITLHTMPPPPPPPPSPPLSPGFLKVTAENVPPMRSQPESGRMAWCTTSTYQRDQIIGR